VLAIPLLQDANSGDYERAWFSEQLWNIWITVDPAGVLAVGGGYVATAPGGLPPAAAATFAAFNRVRRRVRRRATKLRARYLANGAFTGYTLNDLDAMAAECRYPTIR